MNSLSPTMDEAIARKYGPQSLEFKATNKVALQEELGWTPEPKRPMLCLPSGMSDALGGKLLEELIPGLLTLPLEIIILGKGSASYGAMFTKLAKEQGHRIAIIPNQEEEIHKMYAAADMALFLADPAKAPELQHCLRYGVVPVSVPSMILENYDQNQESGNAFVFEKPTVWHAFAAAVRALETWRFPFDWRTIQKHCMQSGA
jgi:glycogen synthase